MAAGFRGLLSWMLGWKSAHRATARDGPYQVVRIGQVTSITLLDPPAGTLYYHWYVDGVYVGFSSGPTRSFQLPADDQIRIVCTPTSDADFDAVANAPDGYPARKTLWWIRSLATDAARYRVEQKEGAGDYETIADLAQETGRWDFSILTGRLADLTEYTWRITPIDAAGNDGTPIVIGPDRIVRTPDAPDFAATFGPGTGTVEFADASSS